MATCLFVNLLIDGTTVPSPIFVSFLPPAPGWLLRQLRAPRTAQFAKVSK